MAILGTAAWYVVAWGAFRRVNGTSRARSFAAGVICFALTVPYFVVVFALGTVTFT